MADHSVPPVRGGPAIGSHRRAWTGLDRALAECTRCGLHRGSGRVVRGEGAVEPVLVVVGDAPTRTQAITGRATAGAAGQLLDNALLDAGFSPDEIFTTHVVKCHPGESWPTADQVAACGGWLRDQLAVLRPRVIVTLGDVATGVLLRRPLPVSRVAGFRLDLDGMTVIPTHHPARAVKASHRRAVGAIRRDLATARAVVDGRLSTGAEAMAAVRDRPAAPRAGRP